MTTRQVTILLLVLGVAVWIGWDIVAAMNATAGDTISEVMLGWAKHSPIVPFTLGVVVGHLFWPQRRVDT